MVDSQTERSACQGTVLLTGFGSFAGITVNPSWEVVRTLAQERPFIDVDGYKYAVKTPPAEVPVTYRAVDEGANSGGHYGSGDDDEPPCLVIHVGAGSFFGLALECVAWNDGYAAADCEGQHHDTGTCIAGAPPILKTSLNLEGVKEAAAACCTTDITISLDAGRYLCEYIFYKSLHGVQEQCAKGLCPLAAGPAALFVHVPPVFSEPGTPCSLDGLVEALAIVVKCCLQQLRERSTQVKELAEMLGTEPQFAAMLLRNNDFDMESAATAFFDSQEMGQQSMIDHQAMTSIG